MTKTTEAAKMLGRKGGLARAAALTPQERVAIATKASRVAAKLRRKKAFDNRRPVA